MSATRQPVLARSEVVSSPGAIIRTLLAPVDPHDFVRTHWQRAPHLVLGDRPADHFDPIFTLAELDHLLADVTIPSTNIDMGANAVGVSPGDYKARSYADPTSVLRLFEAGNTIILRGMHLFSGSLRRLCLATSAFFRCPTQANVYITPAGQRSSYPHWDAHDIFVIQLSGRKTWTLYENEHAPPHPTFEFNPDLHPIGAEVGELELRPGDTAYVPRGLAHNPFALENSVHIALGVQCPTWYDIVDTALQGALADLPLTRTSPPFLWRERGGVADGFDEQLEAVLRAIFDRGRADHAAIHLADAVASSAVSSQMEGRFQQAVGGGTSITDDTVLCLPDVLPSHTSHAGPGGATRVLVEGLEFAVEDGEARMADHLIVHGEVAVHDLPHDDPAARIAFARALHQSGCAQPR
ncbi:MAG: JmjC domain-containing protein [Acidimicrobiales bacterium]